MRHVSDAAKTSTRTRRSAVVGFEKRQKRRSAYRARRAVFFLGKHPIVTSLAKRRLDSGVAPAVRPSVRPSIRAHCGSAHTRSTHYQYQSYISGRRSPGCGSGTWTRRWRSMTMSNKPNWPAVSVPIITQRAPRPLRAELPTARLRGDVPEPENIPPEPPAPALLILDRSVSAGCEMMAAETPATTPGRATPRCSRSRTSPWGSSRASRRSSPRRCPARRTWPWCRAPAGEDRAEAGVEGADHALLPRELGHARHHAVRVRGLDTRRMRVASSGHRKMSAMNSAAADEPR